MNRIGQVYRFSWPYLRRYWTRLAFGILFSLLFALSNGSFIWATRTLTDRFSEKTVIVEKNSAPKMPADLSVLSERLQQLNQFLLERIERWLPRVGRPLDWRQIVGVLLFLPLLVGIRSVADYLANYCIGWVSERVLRDLRLDVMEKLTSLSLDFFTRSTTGDLLTRINVDSQNLLRALRIGGADLIKESGTVVALVGGLALLDWQLTLAALLLLAVCVFPLVVLGKKARRAMKASMTANVMQSSQLVELLNGIRVIQAFGLEAEEMARFRQSSARLVHAGMKGVQAKELTNPIIAVISMLGLGLLLLYNLQAGRSGSELAAFLAGVVLIFLPVRKLAAVHILFEQASVGTDRLQEILREQPLVTEPPHPRPLPSFASALTLERVGFAYRDREVLRDLDLAIPRGRKLGIAGESGSGKTTVLNLLFRFYDPTRGRVCIDGLDLREVSTRALRQQMALVSQDVVIFDQTVAENIACGKLGASRAEVETAARAADAHEFIQDLPQGYDTRVGERGVTLSGGQRQRLAIARAFVRNAPILVLDEATAALDSASEAEVQRAIDRLAEHRTVICVAHRLSTLASMDCIVVLAEGRIVERGGFEELLRQGGLFAGMAARQGIFPTPLPPPP
jgi:subfamily B ATP-binding cassette protein MsbA